MEEAARLAALAGGASGLATGAVLAAALATAGVSLAAVPAVAAAALAELLYTARLQVRLVYDLAALARYPLDPDDPDDLYKIFALSYGVVFTQAHLLADLDRLASENRGLLLRRAILGQVDAERRASLLLLGPQIGRAGTRPGGGAAGCSAGALGWCRGNPLQPRGVILGSTGLAVRAHPGARLPSSAARGDGAPAAPC